MATCDVLECRKNNNGKCDPDTIAEPHINKYAKCESCTIDKEKLNKLNWRNK